MKARVLIFIGMVVLLAPLCFGQSNLATLTGTVTDSGGGVIPGADVTVINTGTAISREQSSNAVGSFTFPALNPGDYQLIVTSEGFQQHVEQGVVLRTGDNRRIDVRLELGQVTESVTVDAQLVALNTENGMIKGDVIVREEIQELPLNGRDFTDLAFFVPGVVPKSSAQGSFASVNGARPTNTNFYVDGFDNRNVQGGAAQVRPNIDALQEFKMEVSGYSAEYGRMAGGILNMSLRSGTNALHGNVSYFMRNDALDARGFFDAEKTKLLQNQFSLTATGPIVKNKTFFMMSYEVQRRDQEHTRLSRVPTPMEIGGDFSNTIGLSHLDNALDVTDQTVLDGLRSNFLIRDRTARGGCNANLVARGRRNSCFPNDLIPASRADPVAQRLFQEYPAPNLGLRRDLLNYRVVDNDNDNFDSYIAKIDHKLGENTLAGRVQYRANNTENPFAGSSTLTQFGNTIDDNRYLLGVDYTHMFSPTFLMEIRGGFSGNDVFQRGAFADTNIIEELGMANFISDQDREDYRGIDDFPLVRLDNHVTIGSATNLPVITDVIDSQASIKLTNIKGSHTIKYGFNYNHVIYERPGVNNARGNYRFRGFRTGGCNSATCKDWGSPVADMYLGWLHNVNVREGINGPDWRQVAMGAFINDDWKVTPKLTMNLGVRWEVNRMPWDVNDKMGSYVPELNKIVLSSDRNLPANFDELLSGYDLGGRFLTAAEAGYPRSVIQTDWNNFTPRMGFAYRLTNKTVIRSGYGLFVAGTILNPFRNSLGNIFPYTVNTNYLARNANPNRAPEVLLRDPLGTLGRPVVIGGGYLTDRPSASGITQNPKQSYLQSWNFTIERELPGGTSVEIDYRGSKGSHLIRRYDFNQAIRTREWFLENRTATGGFAENANSLRPNPDWNAINFYNTGSNSSYNATSISWRKRSRGGVFWRVNYSFSKSIDDASRTNGSGATDFANALDRRNLRLERGRSTWDRRHVFTAVGSYQLPFGSNRRWGRSWGTATNALLGGWQLSGTQTAYSGSPFTVTAAFADVNLGESQRPNRLSHGAQPNEPSLGAIRGSDYPFFDTRAFADVPSCVDGDAEAGTPLYCPEGAFALGSSGRNILDGPGLLSANIALSKNFEIREGMRLQLRIESFNFINRTNFLMTNQFRQFNGVGGGYFTRVGNIGRGGGPRIFQYAVKLRF